MEASVVDRVIDSKSGQGERCDVSRNDVGITREDGLHVGARRGARRPSFINKKRKKTKRNGGRQRPQRSVIVESRQNKVYHLF